MTTVRKLVSLTPTEYNFITSYDPERERSASRRDLVAVIEHIQAVIAEGAQIAHKRVETPVARAKGMPHALDPESIERLRPGFLDRAPGGEPDECWPWQGHHDANGYGVLGSRVDGRVKMFRAHRLAWVFSTGQAIPEALTIDHLCRVKDCVNPAHLEVVTHAENVRRRPLRKRESQTLSANQRRCPNCNSVFHRAYIRRHVCR